MKKKGLIGLLLIGLLLTGCGSREPNLKAEEIETNTLYVNKKGAVISGIAEGFEKEYYIEADLTKFIEEQIEGYNAEKGEERVTLSSLLIEEGKMASMVVKYDTVEDYAALNKIEARIMTFEEAQKQGLLPEAMINMTDGKRTKKADLKASAKDKVLFLQEEYDVILEGKVLYYQNSAPKSTESVHTSGDKISIIIFK